MLLRRTKAALLVLAAVAPAAYAAAQSPVAEDSSDWSSAEGGFALASDSPSPIPEPGLGCADGSCGGLDAYGGGLGCDGACGDGCSGGACGGCGGCGCCGSRIWVRAEYLYWWVQGGRLPPLLTTSPEGTPRDIAGVLGDNFTPTETTSILYGAERVGTDPRSGGRLQLGYWLDNCQTLMAGGDFFALGDGTTSFTASTVDYPILARPFFNVQPETGDPRQDAALVSFPDVVTGTATVRTESEILGAGAYLRQALYRNCGHRLDLLYGYRFLRVDDYLQVTDSIESIDEGSQIPVGTTFDSLDAFDTHNEFHGGEIGGIWEAERGCWGFSVLGRVAFGNVRQTARIWGWTIVTVPDVNPVTTTGGLLAQPTNIGTYRQDEFAVVPEAQASVSYRINCRLRATVGYTFMYLSDVARAPDQIDLSLNPTQFNGGVLEGPAQPAFAFRTSDIWLQGVSFGVEYKY
jgi:hypothetical protein